MSYDSRGLYGHHPDCPYSRHADSILVRTDMSPCTHCDVADKAEKRGRDDESHDIYQMHFVFTQEQWYAEVERIQQEERAKYINPGCVWGQGECIPDCPSCKRMNELYAERSKGYEEGLDEGRGETPGWAARAMERGIKGDSDE